MEMHQVRYFLAMSQTMNFTRAAELCNVAQPSLTRAIKLLERELGGDLFRRERKLTHLTDFGHRMLPFLRQCYDSVQTAKTVAQTIHSGALAPLTLAVSHSIDLSLLASAIADLANDFPGLALKFMRGSATEISEFLKNGDAELAIAGVIEKKWERLNAWPLFAERFSLIVRNDDRCAELDSIEPDNVRDQRLLMRPYCENHEECMRALLTMPLQGAHELASDDDMMKMIEAGLGIGLMPDSTVCPSTLRRKALRDRALERTVFLYNVAGRDRSQAADAMMKSLRARDWEGLAR